MTTVFAFQSWWNGGTQVSRLFTGDDALSLRDSHYSSGTFATLHFGGIDVLDQYISTVNANMPKTHSKVDRSSFI